MKRHALFMPLAASTVGACGAVLGIDDYSDRIEDSGVGADHTTVDVTSADVIPDMETGMDSGADGDADADSAPPPGCASDAGNTSPGPSCAGLASTCGPTGTTDCCASSVVPCGTHVRTGGTVMLSDFRLDTYEITVGRFRNFVAAYSPSMISAGAGNNPNNASDPGWDTAWNASLPADATALTTALKCDQQHGTWSDTAGANERLPINCLTWFEAQAFCTWDGGRLATEAEWEYAAAGGAENRTYPWGETVPSNDGNLAVWGCYYINDKGVCTGLGDIGNVGAVSPGNAKWGQADMAGNVFEWVQDWLDSPYPVTCVNCADLTLGSSARVVRGGGFAYDATHLTAAFRDNGVPSLRSSNRGARCARNP